MKLQNKLQYAFPLLPVIVYAVLTVLCANHCYFWDNIQQTSKEAHWFYLTDFSSLLIPAQHSGLGIVATGYHPPLMGIMTAALWKVFGYHLWVSHVFVFFVAIMLIFNAWKLVQYLFPDKYVGWVLLILLLEPTLLAQFAIASPDFILFTAFVVSLRAVLEQRQVLLAFGLFFLCGVNMRGIFVGGILFLVSNYYLYLKQGNKLELRSILKSILPYFPILILLLVYYVYYFMHKGWFFTNSAYAEHYAMPGSVGAVIKHFLEYGIRSVENGRIGIWLIGIAVVFFMVKKKLSLSIQEKTLFLFFILMAGLYLLFVFITQMPFSGRYFMPQFFLLTLVALSGIIKLLQKKRIRFLFILVLCLEFTGHFWIYPDIISKSWDSTLAHLPYYELRNDCFNYIDQQKLDYKDISAGFCLYGDRRFIELAHAGLEVGTDTRKKYYIYSNISNEEDELQAEFKDKTHWTPVKRFKKGFVFITLYENRFYHHKIK